MADVIELERELALTVPVILPSGALYCQLVGLPLVLNLTIEVDDDDLVADRVLTVTYPYDLPTGKLEIRLLLSLADLIAADGVLEVQTLPQMIEMPAAAIVHVENRIELPERRAVSFERDARGRLVGATIEESDE